MPTRSARISTAPTWLIDPAKTSSPTVTSTGSGSPVMRDWSGVDSPTTTVPSTGMRPPGATTMMSPSATLASGKMAVPPLLRTWTVSGRNDMRSVRASRPRSIERSSRISAASTNAVITRAVVHSPIAAAATIAMSMDRQFHAHAAVPGVLESLGRDRPAAHDEPDHSHHGDCRPGPGQPEGDHDRADGDEQRPDQISAVDAPPQAPARSPRGRRIDRVELTLGGQLALSCVSPSAVMEPPAVRWCAGAPLTTCWAWNTAWATSSRACSSMRL